MKEKIRDHSRLEHIQTAINYIFEFAQDKTIEELSTDKMMFFAIVKNIEIIGEAASRLTDDFRQEYNQVPWLYIIKMRHVLVHDYYQISVREVWKVIHEDLQPLLDYVSQLIKTVDWKSWEKETDG
ncbi:MAG: DUF86 domain-containing protein [Bacteroidaceae bacterium]|nr:DUF86 domain-containing protein [Bacteroidaceae bacterium]